MRLALLLISLFSCLAAKLSGPASYFKPNFGAEDREKLEKKLEELKAARAAKEAAKAAEKAGAGAGAPGPPDTDADTAPPPPETDGADGAVDLRQRVASWRQRSAVAMSGVLSRSRRLRAPAAVVLALGWWRTRIAVKLSCEIKEELEALRELTATRHEVERPPMPDPRRLLGELRERRAILSSHVLPMLRQLEEVPPPLLAERSMWELSSLNATLSTRVGAVAKVLGAYLDLGQDPPPGFRGWSITKLGQRYDNIAEQSPSNRRVITHDTDARISHSHITARACTTPV